MLIFLRDDFNFFYLVFHRLLGDYHFLQNAAFSIIVQIKLATVLLQTTMFTEKNSTCLEEIISP